MKTKSFFCMLTALLIVCNANAQSPLLIPDTLSGNNISLTMRDTMKQFVTGFNSNTIGYNTNYLGPTIILNKWQNVTMHVTNQLIPSDTTTCHWHGLHVAPENDGSGHTPIFPSTTWSPSFTVMDNAGTYWYHPHMDGQILQQVVMGGAGMIIVRDSIEAALTLPRTYGVDDVPLICQFKTMDTTTFQFDTTSSSYSPDNFVMTNGVINPYVNSPAQVVRYRILNASAMRVFRLGFSDNRTFYQIASDDGLLNAPVPLTRLTLGVGERAEILVDLSGDLGNTIYLKSFGNELPPGFPGGPPSTFCLPQGPLDNITFNLLQINVVAQTANSVTTIPSTLTTNTVWPTAGATVRNFTLMEDTMCHFLINAMPYNMNVNNFTTQKDNIEIWHIQNTTPIAHPFHIHGSHFYILTRNGNAPPLNEQGRKDEVIISPGETVELITKYETFCDTMTPYMYHCHILVHEDMGMMGQFIVQCLPTGTLETQAAGEGLQIYPNPSNGKFQIQISKGQKAIGNVEIFNKLGQEIYKSEIINSLPDRQAGKSEINLSHQPNGIYFVKVIDGEKIYVSKLVKE